MHEIFEACHKLLQLESDPIKEVKDYIDSRVSLETQKIFQFGYFPKYENLDWLYELGLSKDRLVDNKLISAKDIENAFQADIGWCFFEHHPMIIPYKNVYGEIIGLAGRNLLSDSERKIQKISKYKNTVFPKSRNLFGLYENKQEIIDQGYVYLVEGQFDVIKAYEKGIRNIVALGNSKLSSFQLNLILRYVDSIFVLLDNDEAGQEGAELIIKNFSNYANIKKARLPEGYHDLYDYLSINDELNPIIQ